METLDERVGRVGFGAHGEENFEGGVVLCEEAAQVLLQAFVEFLRESGTDLKAECYVPKVVDALIRDGKADVRVIDTSGKWFGVTYPEDKAEVVASIKALVDAGEYPAPLWG